ncbi:MAG TPA: hypothetical protein VJ963_04895 [Bacteroidales bacterium]|nr:hypothetical protein [Bacteroidales bacterium]
MRHIALILFILTISFSGLNGQTGSDTSSKAGVLSLRIKSLTFVRDDEYFNSIGSSKFVLVSSLPGFTDKSKWIEGYTLIGYFFQPELVYNPSDRVTLRAGAYLLKYSGKDKFTKALPVFSTSFKINGNTTLVMGTLPGCDSHKLYDPLFDHERLYKNYYEEGFQVTGNYRRIFNDTYVSWENFIFSNDTTREIINFGESFRYSFPEIAGFIHPSVPVQVQFKHFGGQISNYPEHMETYFNMMAGLGCNFDIAGKKYGEAGIEALGFLNREFPGKPPSGITRGSAIWIKGNYIYKSIHFGASYWKGHNFFAPDGNPVYGSVKNHTSDYVIPDREIINNTLYIDLFPENFLDLFLGAETYYDVRMKTLDYAFTLHLNLDKLIKLARLKQ